MNEPSRTVTTAVKAPRAAPRQSTAATPNAASQAKLPDTKPEASQTQGVRRRVRFELDVPKAKSVFAGGTFNNWSATATPLVFVGGTRWSRDLLLPPGRYEYRFVVDGKWVEPPQAKAYVPNPDGGRNGVFDR
jgi:1,4-alpha-glucan branching enzyme